jgi:hypothetical protein
MKKQRGLGLRDAAAARVRKILVEQHSGDQGAHNRYREAPPGRTARRVHAGTKILRDEDERSDDQAHNGPDHEGQNQENFIFMLPQAIGSSPVPQSIFEGH